METKDEAITNDVRNSAAQEEEQSTYDRSSSYGDIGVSIAIAAAVGVFLGALALRSKVKAAMEFISSNASSDGFCCPENVAELTAYINASLDPCDDFFVYSCSNRISSNLNMKQPAYSQLEQFVSTGVPPDPKNRGGQAARFLVAYYQTCIQNTGGRDSFIPQVALSIVRATQDLLRHPTTRRSLMFMVEMGIRYRIPSILDISYQARKSWLHLGVRALCDIGTFADCLSSSVEAVRNAIGSVVTVEDTLNFMSHMCRRFPDVYENRTYALANTTEAISGELWKFRDIEAALNSVGWEETKATVLEVFGLRQIRVVHDAFEGTGSCGAKAAYLLWHSVVEATVNYLPPSKPSYTEGFVHCLRKARNIGDMWVRMQDEVASTNEKDEQMVSTFAAVKAAVLSDAESSWLFDTDDFDRLRTLVGGLTVVTASTDAWARSIVQVPSASSVFAENVLRGNKYAHALALSGMERQTKPLFLFDQVEIIDARRVEVSPFLYEAVQPASPGSDLLNMATLGYSLAQTIWDFILRGNNFSPNVTANVERLAACFADHYGVSDAKSEGVDIVAASLGLSSVVKTLALSPDWHTVQIAWSTVYMSHAQLFYLLAATHRCPFAYPSYEDLRRVVTPMRYVADFHVAFNCSTGKLMRSLRSCSINR